MNTFETSALVGGGSHGEAEEMVIYVGEGLNGVYNRPYFDNTMKTNFTVQVNININIVLGLAEKTRNGKISQQKCWSLKPFPFSINISRNQNLLCWLFHSFDRIRSGQTFEELQISSLQRSSS